MRTSGAATLAVFVLASEANAAVDTTSIAAAIDWSSQQAAPSRRHYHFVHDAAGSLTGT